MYFGLSRWFLAFAFLSIVIFAFFPQVDLIVSGLFYKDGSFFLKYFPLNRYIYYFAPRIAIAFGLLMAIVFVVLLIMRKRELFSIERRGFLFLFLALLIGPGLVVNGIVKEFSGRARPSQIVQFGGDKEFTPPTIISDNCATNCSFSSGHAAAGFYFVALSLLFKGALSRKLLIFGLIYGGVVGFVRIIQGGHFFSDVLFSFIFVYASSAVLHYLMFKEQKNG